MVNGIKGFGISEAFLFYLIIKGLLGSNTLFLQFIYSI